MRRFAIVILILYVIIMFSGCWDYSPLENNFVVTGIGIDISRENPNDIMITAFGPSFAEDAEAPYIQVVSTGSTLSDALKNAQNKTYRVLAMSHVRIILISETAANKGFNQYFDVFLRNGQISADTLVSVAAGRAEDFFTKKLDSFPNTAMYLVNLLKTSETKTKANSFTYRELINRFYSDSDSVFLPYITQSENSNELKYERICLFTKDKLVEILDPDETITFLLLRNVLKRANITVGRVVLNSPEALAVTYRVFPHSRKVEVKKENDEIRIHLTFKLRDELIELEPLSHIIQNEEDLLELEQMAERDLEKKLRTVIGKVQKINNTDGLGIGDYVRVKYPSYYKQMSWLNELKNVKFDVSVKFKVSRIGVIK